RWRCALPSWANSAYSRTPRFRLRRRLRLSPQPSSAPRCAGRGRAPSAPARRRPTASLPTKDQYAQGRQRETEGVGPPVLGHLLRLDSPCITQVATPVDFGVAVHQLAIPTGMIDADAVFVPGNRSEVADH